MEDFQTIVEMKARAAAAGGSSGADRKSRVESGASSYEKPSMLRRFVAWQQRLSAGLDRLLPASYRTDGADEFLSEVVQVYLPQNGLVYDVGGGKHPVLSRARKSLGQVRVIGFDIDPVELSQAPPGCYDHVVCADIASYTGDGNADLVLCASVIEHVRDTRAALRAVASILKAGGYAVFYVPCRNAVFARLNLILPEKVKRLLLAILVPESKGYCGFPAFYDQCTPAAFTRAANSAGLQVEVLKPYWYSPYFACFTPLFLLWRGWVLLSRAIAGRQAAESFAIVLRRAQ